MAVVSVQEAQPHATVTQTRDGRRYQCPYNVRVDSARDSGDLIIDHLATLGRALNSTLRYADMENNLVFCSQVAPTRKQGSTTEWSVVLTYEPPQTDQQEPDSRPGTDGEPTDQPLDWAYDIDSGTQLVQVPVWKATNMDPFPLGGTGLGYVRPVGTIGPVVNSAGVVLDPPLMTEVPERWYRISGIVDELSSVYLDLVAGSLNSNVLQFSSSFRAAYNAQMAAFREYSLKCSGAAARKFTHQGEVYYRYEYEFRYRPRDYDIWDGWLEQVLDRGITRWAGASADDGFGGQLSSDDIEDGMAEAAAIKGPLGDSIGEMVLLDGHGAPLLGDDAAEGVYFRWLTRPLWNFADLPLDIFEQV